MTYIKRLEITNFGKFTNHTVDFEKGYTELVLPNESGKSTITDFMLFMLYDFTKTTKRTLSLEDNLFLKYLPWSDVGYIAGAMEIVCDGETYRVERRHQRSKTNAPAVIRDSTGGEIATDKEPGEYFFGIDRDTFMRTFLVRQTDIRFKSTDGIVTALKNLVTTGDEDLSFDAAKKTLTDEYTSYKHMGRRSGRVFDIQKEITALEMEILDLERTLASLKSNTEQLEIFKDRLASLSKRESELKRLEPSAKAYDAKQILDKYAKVKAELDALYARVKAESDHSITDADFENASAVFSERDMLSKRRAELESELDSLKAKNADLTKDIPNFEYIRENEANIRAKLETKPKPNTVLLMCGGIMLLMGVIMGIMLPVMFAFAAVGVLLLGLAFVLKIPAAKVDADIRTGLELFDARKQDIELNAALVGNAVSKLEALERECDVNRGKCEMLKNTLGVSDVGKLSELMAQRNNADIIKRRILELEQKSADLLEGKTETELRDVLSAAAPCEYGIAELDRLIIETTRMQADVTSRIAALSQDAHRAYNTEREIFDKRQKITELRKELKNAEYRIRVLDIALSAMNEAYDKINKMFSPRLTETAKTPLSLLTDGKYSEVYLDKDFVIRVKADGELRELGYFSRGTADAVYFAVRRAVAELITEGKSVPLIMDDPFWSLDDNRLENAREYLTRLGETAQIIVFSARK